MCLKEVSTCYKKMQNATADAFQLPHKVNKDSRWFGVLGETFSEIFFGDSLQRLFKPCYVFKCSESADINNNNNNNNWEFKKYSKDKLSDNFVILCSTKNLLFLVNYLDWFGYENWAQMILYIPVSNNTGALMLP